MRLDSDGHVDSNCFAPVPDTERETDRCGDPATTYVNLPSGVRRYVCADHAEDVDRFDDDGTDDPHPQVGVCSTCRRLTPVEYIDTVDGTCVECGD